ncbi:TonB-dependent receptor [Flammeovirga yaeyamensis]|uniref:TonB-dependent receptor n=1 Tax=Flammeovirga yaeyamensis TaxID=367791 RepID=A0AAX1MYZ9_9BACT|nr:outer membrane beta-barrel family protein [Flammeovirga yaeyamensis]MBB3696016.1 outer membrane receptor protein involved in Fe transport [Flammeovirga yaeyamensis]NMF34702.1 TonB-dependent receptor [Flammeovirga yaeyamensis]QWG00469.1 TonB-dependent receptor [Flammeovirga yaeyamensis]
MKTVTFSVNLIVLLFVTTFLFANDNLDKKGNVKGQIIDQNDGSPVGYATVSLNNKDNISIGGGLTDDAGQFRIKNVPYGTYTLIVQFVGYNTLQKELKVNAASVDVGQIKIGENVEQLEEVEVRAEKTSIERSIDKKVVNVSDAMIAEGNSVSEVLQTIPEISVGSDGAISLRGESNVRVLIDGKPSQIDPAQIFQTLPAGSIEKIEVITNPSAKYDPDGLSGIINVITKKDKMKGLNGSANIGAGTGEKYNGYLGLNYRIKKFNFFGQGSYGENRFENQKDLRRIYSDSSIPSFDQKGDNIRNGRYYNTKLGADYFLDSTNTITFYAELWDWKGGEENFFTNNNIQGDQIIFSQKEYGNQNNRASGQSFSLNHRKEFKKGILESDAFYNGGTSDFSTSSTLEQDASRNSSVGTDANWNYASLKVDYSHKINDKSSLETGYKGELLDASAQISNNLGGVINNYSYDYDQYINSLYGSYSIALGSYSIKAGLRGEVATIDGTVKTESGQDTTYSINYASLFPTLHVQKKMGEFNTVGVSYSRRINRPGIFNMLPIEQRSNSSTVSVGNPNLQPSYTNSISFDHSYNKNKLGLNTSVYLRHSTDIIRNVSRYDSVEDVTVYTWANLGSSMTGGASISANYQIAKWWNIDANLNFFYLEIQDDNEEFTVPQDANPINWTAKLNTRFTLPKNFTIQIMGRYAGQQYDAQNITQPTYALNLAVKKAILKRKGNISFKIDDIINSGFTKDVYGRDFQEQTYYLQERPVYRLSFSYAFGGQFQGRKARKLHSSGGMN